MFSVTVEHGFTATHHVQLPDGAWEAPHSHDWFVRVGFRSSSLDEHGMVVDFVIVQDQLRSVLSALHHTDLNQNSALRGVIPTAEIVAQFIFTQLRNLGQTKLFRVEVTEAPGCMAAYERDEAPHLQTGPIN